MDLYAEWYLWNRLGIGTRIQGIADTEGVGISNLFITANFVPWISDSKYSRLILIAGAGTSNYEYTNSGSSTPTGSMTTDATMVGIFIDWGGEDFGARFGFERVMAQSGTVNGLLLDASGGSMNVLDLRWAIR